MSDNSPATIAAVAVALAAQRQKEADDARARETLATFDPKTSDLAGRRAYAKAVFRIEGDGEPATRGDRTVVAVLMLTILGGALWGWFDLAVRMTYSGDPRTFEQVLGSFMGACLAVLALLIGGLTWMGLRFIVTGRS